MKEKEEAVQVNQWEEIARYKKAITDATNAVLAFVPAIAVQPVLGAVNAEITSAVNSILAAEMEKLGERDNV